MQLGDPEAALEKLREFHRHSEVALRNRREGVPTSIWEQLHMLVPLVEGIALRIDPTNVAELARRTDGGAWRLGAARDATLRLIGILEKREEHQRILGAEGPALAAGGLHRWVWDAAADLWDGGHHAQAVEDAFKSVERRTQVKVGDLNLSGKKLYAQSFSTKEPTAGMSRLRFPDIDEAEQKDTWTSAHEGAMHLGMACAQGIRNLRAHPSGDITEQEALEQLAALSVLARWVDACKVVHADPAPSDGG